MFTGSFFLFVHKINYLDNFHLYLCKSSSSRLLLILLLLKPFDDLPKSLLILTLLLRQLIRELLQEVEEKEADEVPDNDDGDVHGQGKPGLYGCHFGVGEEEEGDAVEDKPAPEEVVEDANHPREPLVGANHTEDGSDANEAVDPNQPTSRPLDVSHQLSQSHLLHAEDEGGGEPLLGGRVNQLQK